MTAKEAAGQYHKNSWFSAVFWGRMQDSASLPRQNKLIPLLGRHVQRSRRDGETSCLQPCSRAAAPLERTGADRFRGRTARFGPAPERQVRDPTGFRNRTVASAPHPSACRLRLQLLMCLNNSMCQFPSASGATQVCSSSLPWTGPKGGAAARGSASTILLSLLFKNQAGRLAFVFVGRRAGLRKLAWRRPCQFYAKHTQWALSASGHLNEEEEHLCINSVISHSNGNGISHASSRRDLNVSNCSHVCQYTL